MNNEDILLKIKEKNTWWEGVVRIHEDHQLLSLAQLPYSYEFPQLTKLSLFEPGIYTIRGIRQIGKSTTLKSMIRKLLLEEKVEPKSVFYFSCDGLHRHEDLYQVLLMYLRDWAPRGPLFLFIDEITFVEEWQRAIKELADEGRLTKATLVLTGSNVFDLRNSAELMPGRRGKAPVLDIVLHPLNFKEFVSLVAPQVMTDQEQEALARKELLQELFHKYLVCGGIPRAINEFYRSGAVPDYVYELYRSWIVGDILKAKKSLAVFEAIIDYLIKALATPLSWYKLGKEAHLASHAAAMDYVELLEAMFVVHRQEFMDPSSKRPVFRKNKKIYFSDPLIFDALRAQVDGFSNDTAGHASRWMSQPENLGKKVEQAICSQLKRQAPQLFYWESEKEIDAIAKHSANRLDFFEIKYQSRVTAAEFKWFEKAFPNQSLTVFTRHDLETAERVRLIPACVGLLLK